VVRGEESVVLGYGETRPSSKVEPNGRSILRMVSITKVMAGHALASMAADGTLKLSSCRSYARAAVARPFRRTNSTHPQWCARMRAHLCQKASTVTCSLASGRATAGNCSTVAR
jgi:hypothetical protein